MKVKALASPVFSTLALLVFILAIEAAAQTATTGSIVVRVRDSADAPIKNVLLSITGPNLIIPQSATTDRDGYARIHFLPPGTYDVTANIGPRFVISQKHIVDVNISRTSSITFRVSWRSEVRSAPVKQQLRVDAPRMRPHSTSIQVPRTATKRTDESKLPASRLVAPNSEGSSPSAVVHYKRAVEYARSRLLNQAVNSFKEAIRLKSDYADAYYGLGQAYFDLGRWSEAIDALDSAIKIDPNVDGAYTKLGESYARLRAENKSVDERKSTTRNNGGSVETILTGSDKPGSRPAPKSSESTMIYRVGVGDVLDIRISGSPTDKSTLFTVTSHGRLEHPLLPRPLDVSGLTTEEIRTKIEAELKGKAINEKTDVLVAVREYVSHTIIVSGLVRNPGTKILRREALPLYVILAEAQPAAEAERASVISKGSAEITTVELADPKAMSLAVRSGDVVSVQVRPQQYFYIGGEVKAPGEKSFRPGLTLTQAILAAGGLSGKANTVQLARESTNGRLAVTRYKLDDINMGKLPDPLIQQGDRITAQ